MLLLFLLIASVAGVKHNLPDDVELVDPKDFGFGSQLDLDKLLGNVKLLPIEGQTDPKTGLKTQVLTVGFEGDENINLDDFELPSQPNSNNTELVQTAFQNFKNYLKKNETTTRKPVVMRRRKVFKKVEKPEPKVVELDSSQIEKLLATGKLKSKKVGESQVIEITQEQLNELYRMENGDEFKTLLSGGTPVSMVTEQAPVPVTETVSTTQYVQPTVSTTTTTPQQPQPNIATIPTTTQPPIIYQFNTKDFENQPQQQYFVPRQPQQYQQQYFQQQPQQYQPQVSKIIKNPTFEFISVPPLSYSTQIKPTFHQDPLPQQPQQSQLTRGKIYFPQQQTQQSEIINKFVHLNTYYEGDGLNYKNLNKNNNGPLMGI